MVQGIHTAGERLSALRGAEAWLELQRLSRQLVPLADDELDAVLTDAPADVVLAAAMAASDVIDRAPMAGPLASRAEVLRRPDPTRFAVICLMRAITGFRAGDFMVCIRQCEQGQRRLGHLEIPSLRAPLLAQQAVASKHLGRREDALRQNLAALRYASNDDTPRGRNVRATLHNNIGVLLLAQGDQEAAVRYLEQAIVEAAGAEDLEGFSTMIHLNLGRLLLREGGDPARAAEHLQRGAELANEAGSVMMQMRARVSLALVRRRQGRLQEALALLDPVVAHWTDGDAPLALASALLSRGRLYTDLGLPQAEDDLVGAFQSAESTESFDLMLEATQALVTFLEGQERFAEACGWHHRRHELERMQFDREKSARMEEMHARHRVEQAEQELIVARDRAEAASRAKSGFLAVTSHELRTPLNAIVGYTELLMDDVAEGFPPEDLGADLGQIHTSAMRLQRLIDRILLLTSLGEGEHALEEVDIDVGPSLRTLLEGLEPTVVARGNRLFVELDPSLDTHTMRTDPGHLVQIVQHLVDNAAAFTEGGTVTVTARRDQDVLVVEVRDTGKGFDASSLDELIQPFQQTDMSYTRAHEGLGLGLTLCRHQVDLLGGVLAAESSPGEGATFRVTLPWRSPEDPKATRG